MRFFVLLALWMAALSCSSNGQPAGASDDAQEDSSGLPAAAQAAYPFPVYTDFEQLKPWLQQSNDTTYVVNFWATWCKPCIAELPYFERLQKEASAEGRKIRVVLVSLDFGKELESKLLPFVQERRLRGQVIALLDDDYNKWIDQVSPEWSGAIPATLIYRGEDRSFFSDAFESYPDLASALAGFTR